MPKIKLPRKSTLVDMTAMCDVSFLLLTFFILTAKFRPYQPVIIDIPTSRSNLTIPDPLMTISVDKEGKVYYSLSSTSLKKDAIANLADKYGDRYPELKNLSPDQIEHFATIDLMGFPAQMLPGLLSEGTSQIEEAEKSMPGVPVDSANNELRDWIMAGRYANPDMRIAIKGDKNSSIKAVQQVIKTLTSDPVNVHQFNLITSLEGPLAAETGQNPGDGGNNSTENQ